MEVKDIFGKVLDRLDIPQELADKLMAGESFDDFNEGFGKDWIHRNSATDDPDVRDKVIGEYNGKMKTKFNQTFGLQRGDTKDLDYTDMFSFVADKTSKELEDLKGKIDNGDHEKTITDLEASVSDWKTKFQERDGNVLDANKALEDLKDTHSKELLGLKSNTLLGSEKSRLGWKSELSEIERTGFDVIVSKKYDFTLEGDSFSPFLKDGTRVRNDAGSKDLSVFEVLEMEANANNLLKNNNADTTPTKVVTPAIPSQGQGRKVAAGATLNSERLNG